MKGRVIWQDNVIQRGTLHEKDHKSLNLTALYNTAQNLLRVQQFCQLSEMTIWWHFVIQPKAAVKVITPHVEILC